MKGLDLNRERREQDGSEWTFGALSPVGLAVIPTTERAEHLPLGEPQYGVEDFQDCATRAPINILETQFNWLLHSGKILPENERWLDDNGYIVDGRITFSDRYIAILAGTTRQGASLKAPLEAIRKYGLIPKSVLPAYSHFTFYDYHNPTAITQEMKNTGTTFAQMFRINYDQVYQHQFGLALMDDMIDVAAYAWPEPINGIYPKTDEPFNHAFALYDLPKFQAFDNYLEAPNDWTKSLAPDYAFYDYGYRIFITEQTSIKGIVSVWQGIVDLLKKQLNYLKSLMKPDYLTIMAKKIQEHEGYFPGSRSYRNANPGNLRWANQPSATGKDKDNFAIFPDYETGFKALKNMLKAAAEGRSKIYKPTDNLYQWANKYAPSSDHNNPDRYAEVVAKAMKVDPKTFTLKDLLQ